MSVGPSVSPSVGPLVGSSVRHCVTLMLLMPILDLSSLVKVRPSLDWLELTGIDEVMDKKKAFYRSALRWILALHLLIYYLPYYAECEPKKNNWENKMYTYFSLKL